jgi:hypothetical protein
MLPWGWGLAQIELSLSPLAGGKLWTGIGVGLSRDCKDPLILISWWKFACLGEVPDSRLSPALGGSLRSESDVSGKGRGRPLGWLDPIVRKTSIGASVVRAAMSRGTSGGTSSGCGNLNSCEPGDQATQAIPAPFLFPGE